MFDSLEVHRFANELFVEDAGAVVDYVRSMAQEGRLDPGALRGMREAIAERIGRIGHFPITVAVAAFVARRAP